MDPKTKALLHTSGAVLASDDPQHGLTEFTVFPPAMGMVVSEQAMMHAPTDDKKVLIARLAQQIGKSVAKAVENQILKAYEMDAQSALALIMDAKKSFWSQAPAPASYTPAGWDPFEIQPGAFVVTAPAPAWSNLNHDIVGDLTTALAMIGKKSKHGGILHLQQPESIWDLPKGHPVFFQGGPHGHISHIEGAQSFAAFDPATKPLEPLDEATYYSETKIFRDLIPGFSKMKQPCPVKSCKATDIEFLQDTIIHLNDHHKWKRERVAEWLETLDHDLTFRTPDEVKAAAEVQGQEAGDMHEVVKNLIAQPLVPDPDLFKQLMGTEAGEEVKNGNSD